MARNGLMLWNALCEPVSEARAYKRQSLFG